MVMMRRGRAGGRLAALAAALAGVALVSAAPAPVKIDVVMVDYEFQPNHLTLRARRSLPDSPGEPRQGNS